MLRTNYSIIICIFPLSALLIIQSLWDTDNYPAVLLNRSQSQIRLEGNDVYLTEDTYTAMEGTINGLKNSRGISIQAEDISDDLYEDVILKDAKQEILTKIYALSENKR